MKPILLHCVGAVVLTFSLAACIPAMETPTPPAPSPTPTAQAATPASSPTPAQVPVATPSPVPTSTPRPASPPTPVALANLPENWMDERRTPGDWSYERESSETFAVYSTGGEAPHAIIRCDLNTRRIGIGRFAADTQSATMRIYTETRIESLNASARSSRYPLVAAEVDANDRLLDAMAVTKGNFAMQVSGMTTLYLPGWAEVTRVIEDCR